MEHSDSFVHSSSAVVVAALTFENLRQFPALKDFLSLVNHITTNQQYSVAFIVLFVYQSPGMVT
jgi:hypothetical protein